MKLFFQNLGALVFCSITVALVQAQVPIKSGPQKGENLPASFHPFNITGKYGIVRDKEGKKDPDGRHHSLVAEFGLNPTVLIFAREPSVDKGKMLGQLLKALDDAVQTDRKIGDSVLNAFVVFLSPDAQGPVFEADSKELNEAVFAKTLPEILERKVLCKLTSKTAAGAAKLLADAAAMERTVEELVDEVFVKKMPEILTRKALYKLTSKMVADAAKLLSEKLDDDALKKIGLKNLIDLAAEVKDPNLQAVIKDLDIDALRKMNTLSLSLLALKLNDGKLNQFTEQAIKGVVLKLDKKKLAKLKEEAITNLFAKLDDESHDKLVEELLSLTQTETNLKTINSLSPPVMMSLAQILRNDAILKHVEEKLKKKGEETSKKLPKDSGESVPNLDDMTLKKLTKLGVEALSKKISAVSNSRLATKLVSQAAKRQVLYDGLESRYPKLKHVIVTAYPDSGPKGYKLSEKSEITVILYRNVRVAANHAFAPEKMTAKHIGQIINDVNAMLGKKKKVEE